MKTAEEVLDECLDKVSEGLPREALTDFLKKLPCSSRNITLAAMELYALEACKDLKEKLK